VILCLILIFSAALQSTNSASVPAVVLDVIGPLDGAGGGAGAGAGTGAGTADVDDVGNGDVGVDDVGDVGVGA